MAPPAILIPQSNSTYFSRTLQGSEGRHFISQREFEEWSKDQPSIRPANGGDAKDSTLKGYR